MENIELTEDEIAEFIRKMYPQSSSDFLTAKIISDLDWRTLLHEAISDWTRIDKDLNSYRWEGKSHKDRFNEEMSAANLER